MSFLTELPPHGDARAARILGAIATGHLDPVTWVPVRCGPVELHVSADWLKIGGGRVPMAAYVAQAAVEALGAVLPTPTIVDAIEAEARARGRLVPFVAWPRWQDDSQLATSTILWREQNIREALGGDVAPDTLVAGALKDVVIAQRLAWMLDRVLISGGRYSNGKKVQDLQTNATAHTARFDGGYAHGVRAIRDACTVDGQPASVTWILRDPTRARWLSAEGALSVVRYPARTATATTIPAAPAGPAPSLPATVPTTTAKWTEPSASEPLRRGHRGTRVKQVQIFLSQAGYACTTDGLFGPQTEGQFVAFQRAHGLAPTGVAGEADLRELRRAAMPAPLPADDGPIPLVQAYSYYPGRQRPIRLIVLHTAEIEEVGYAAENLAKWAAGPSAGVSWHYAIDNDSTIQCVRDEDTAFHAKGANADGVGIELSGRASQGAAGWADAYSQAVLRRAAKLVAQLCRKHGLPTVFLDAAALQRGEAGITTHAEVTRAYRQSTHTDPGAAFRARPSWRW